MTPRQRRPRLRLLPNPILWEQPIIDLSSGSLAAGLWDDRRRVLTKLRRNRLVDTFFGSTAVSLPNPLREYDTGRRGLPADDFYLAMPGCGPHFVVPVFVMSRTGTLIATRLCETLAMCRKAYPPLTPRPVAVQFVRDGDREMIVMFALAEIEGEIRALDEKHYRLVPASEITADDLNLARVAASGR